MNKLFHVSNNKKNPVNLYYGNFQPFLSSHNISRNFTFRTYTDSNLSNNLIKSKKWNLSDMIDIKKKLKLTIKRRINFKSKKFGNKKISSLSQIHMNNNNQRGTLINKLNLNNTVGNKKILSSFKNSKKKISNDSHKNNKGNIINKRNNITNISNNSFKSYKGKLLRKKKIKKKTKNNIPFNINKININIINNNNININTIKTEGNSNNYIEQMRKFRKQKEKNYTLDKLPQFDELLKKNNTKEKDKILPNKLKINNSNVILKKRNNISYNLSSNNSTNYSLSNRLNNIISTHNEISVLSKKKIKNIKKNIIKNKHITNEKSLEHKKIIPINYFQDYKKKKITLNKKIKKEFIDYGKFVKIKYIKHNFKKINKNRNDKNNIIISKPKRPFSKEEKTNNIIKIKEKSKDKIMKNNILKNVSKKGSLPEQILIKKIIKCKNLSLINIISKSEIKKRRAKSNNKAKDDNESQKIYLYDDDKDDNECDIDDILQNKKIPKGKIDNFDDLYSVVKILNFNNTKEKDKVFSIDDNSNFLNYKKNFDKIWQANLCKKN